MRLSLGGSLGVGALLAMPVTVASLDQGAQRGFLDTEPAGAPQVQSMCGADFLGNRMEDRR